MLKKRVFPYFLIFVLLVVFTFSCSRIFIQRGFPDYNETIKDSGVKSAVDIYRDSVGVPHIYADSIRDLYLTLGYIHAQDRLWQMELYRRLAKGRLAEIAGRKAIDADIFFRTIGLPKMTKVLARNLPPQYRELLEAYVAGINLFLMRGDEDLPLEFRTLSLAPEPWKIEDIMAPYVLNSWFLATNYEQEIVAVKAIGKLNSSDFKLLFPSHPGAALPDDSYYDDFSRLTIAPLRSAAFVLFESSRSYTKHPALSNGWIVASAKSASGSPIVAGDPHLGVSVPGVWYFVHLEAPDMRVAGGTFPGIPLVLIGHNDRIAWTLTNVMADYVDLFVVRVDPDDPTCYFAGGRPLRMTEREELIRVKNAKPVKVKIFTTIYGPVLSDLVPGCDAVVALKWYGTMGEKAIGKDRGFHAFFSINRARSVAEALEAGRYLGLVGQSVLAGDVNGHIGWHAAGWVPRRRGYSGRLPADGGKWGIGWNGFLSYDELPGLYDPPEGFIFNSNQCIQEKNGSHISYAWAAPYRAMMVEKLLRMGRILNIGDMARIQTNVHSAQAEKLIPKIAGFEFESADAKLALNILRSWDKEVRPDSRGSGCFRSLSHHACAMPSGG